MCREFACFALIVALLAGCAPSTALTSTLVSSTEIVTQAISSPTPAIEVDGTPIPNPRIFRSGLF